MHRLHLAAVVVSSLSLAWNEAERPAEPDATIDFVRDVKPILARNCFACHGPDPEHREAGLRLDTFEGANGDREGSRAVVPGDRDESDLWLRIHDARRPMPPRDSGFELSDAERELLGRWIDSGAEYREHWSFERVERPTPPDVGADVHPIDAFVRERLEGSGLAPAEEADRRTLARRLSLDLIGLPPDAARVDALAADERPDAVERYVDELLASPHYGEHWAALWLDLARYADSKGYGSDPLRTIWRWRDWVIEAFDQNMPFDRFTELQMAGDLLPDATWETQLATAFHRNTMVNTEGGTDNEEFRVAAVKDRANTTGQVWLGLTVGCAECHSHKFDPITQEEYYAFYGLFDQTADRDQNDDSPKIATPTRAQVARMAALDEELAVLDERIAEHGPLDPEFLARWVAEQSGWRRGAATAEARSAQVTGDAGAFTVEPDSAPERDVVTVTLADVADVSHVLVRAVADPALPNGGPGLSPGNGNFVLSEIRAAARQSEAAPVTGRFVRVELPGSRRILSLAEVEVLAGDQNAALGGTATQSSVAYSGPPELAIDGNTDGAHGNGSVTHTDTEDDPWWEVDLGAAHAIDRVTLWNRIDGTLEERLAGAIVQVLDAERRVVWESLVATLPEPSTTLVPRDGAALALEPVEASFEQDDWTLAQAVDGDAGTGWAISPRMGASHEAVFALRGAPAGRYDLVVTLEQEYGAKHLLGRFEVLWSDATGRMRALPAELRAALDVEPQAWSADARAALTERAAADDPAVLALHDERRALLARRDAVDVVQTPVLVPLEPDRRRQTHVLLKGNFLQKGEPVEAGVPAKLANGRTVGDRRELAAWLTSRDNPLTARVHANRLWARLFGVGLVETEEDFGAQGSLPTHPALLDWLAAEFMESGWDQQHLLRTIVASATYRQSAAVTDRHEALDPDNRLLARGPRFRLSAEQVRDSALAISGLLSREKFGPSVYPPQPDGLWQAAFNGADRTWRTSTGPDRYRRGLYVFLRRSSPYPSMQVFDAPTRETCTVRRIRTNTALQAFVTLNDPVYVECAQALARRIVREAPGDDAARARHGFRLATQRAATDAEVDALVGLVASQRAHFAEHAEEAVQLATDPLGPLADGDEPVELAVWSVAANVLLNLDEVLTKP